MPVPLIDTTAVAPEDEVTEKTAVLAPVVVGRKLTFTVQVLPAASFLPEQPSSVMTNSGLDSTAWKEPPTSPAHSPKYVTESVIGVLDAPVRTLPKSNPTGAITIELSRYVTPLSATANTAALAPGPTTSRVAATGPPTDLG